MEEKKSAVGDGYLCFRLDHEEYGLPILNVREIIGMMDFAVVPQTHPYVRGIINLRGKIVPIIDLRAKFGMEETAYHERTCIIIAEVENESRKTTMGLIVDSVTEVDAYKADDIEPAPNLSEDAADQYITGIAKVGNKIKILLDVGKIVSQTALVVET